jgi:hypothetical protein
MNYQDFQLSAKRLDLISTHVAKRKTEQYVKEHGVEPTEEIEATFYELTPEETEKYRRAFFANDYIDNSELHIEMPDVIPNTPAQDAVAEDAVNTFLGGTTGYTADSINNITIPAEVNIYPRLTGNFQNGATVESETTKTVYIFNTSEEPIDMTILTKAPSVYLTGNFNNIYFNGRTINGANSTYAVINGELDLVPATSGLVTVNGIFEDNATVKYLGDQKLTINHQQNEEANINVFAPNSTVTIGGKLNDLEATVSDDTLNLRYTFHCDKLKMNKGNIVYQGIDPSDFYNELIGESVQVTPFGYSVTGNNITTTKDTPGVYPIAQDFTADKKCVVFGAFASGKYKYDWNGHHASFGDASRGSFLIRNEAEVHFVDTVGGGGMTNTANSYGIWAASEGVVVNVYGGTYEAYDHVLYAEYGHINVYGGTFKCLSEDKTFTLNCLDKAYTAGTAVITVYGGKYYNFDPSHAMSEPGKPVSYLAEGYTVTSYQDGDDTIYEVVPQA